MDNYNKTLFVTLNTIAISTLTIILSYIHQWTNVTKETKWLVGNSDSIFQKIKNGLFPWILVYIIIYGWVNINNYGLFYFLRNFSAGVIGFVIYFFAMMILYYIWYFAEPNATDKQQEGYDIASYIISVLFGVLAWLGTSNMIISKRLDRSITLIGTILIILWFETCTYKQCPNIY